MLLKSKGDYGGAEPLYRRTLAGCEKTLGPNHPNTLTCIYNLAALLHTKMSEAIMQAPKRCSGER
jgi:hypothetical protein